MCDPSVNGCFRKALSSSFVGVLPTPVPFPHPSRVSGARRNASPTSIPPFPPFPLFLSGKVSRRTCALWPVLFAFCQQTSARQRGSSLKIRLVARVSSMGQFLSHIRTATERATSFLAVRRRHACARRWCRRIGRSACPIGRKPRVGSHTLTFRKSAYLPNRDLRTRHTLYFTSCTSVSLHFVRRGGRNLQRSEWEA